jgi:hypothetical protein
VLNALARRLAEEAAQKGPKKRAGIPVQRRRPADDRPPGTPGPTRTGQTAGVPRQSTSDEHKLPPRADHIPEADPIPENEPGAEASTRSVQNTLLSLGGVMLAVSAIILAGVAFQAAAPPGQAVILILATAAALAAPLELARRDLTATAETFASFAFLLLLIDGYVLNLRVAAFGAVPTPLYLAVLFGLTVLVAAAYRMVTRLAAPLFVAILLSQPIPSLVAWQLGAGRPGFALTFALVALADLAVVVMLSRRGNDAARQSWPRWSLEVTWVLYGLSLAAAVAFSAAALTQATDVAGAVRAAGPLLLAAAVAIAGGQFAGSDLIRHISTGGGTLTIIIAITRVDAVANWPNHTLMLSAALAAAAALVANALPEGQRPGLFLAALGTASVTAVVVLFGAVTIAVATVHAAVTPQAWAADVGGYAALPSVTSGQVPMTAILLAVAAAAATPAPWRWDAIVLGGFLVVLASPGTGAVPWWLIPLVGMAGATLATFAALLAQRWQSALLGVGVSALLGLYAAATGLATPGLTAATFAAGALLGAATAVVAYGWPGTFGPYLDRVADVATGGAVLAFPVAVGAFAYVVGTPFRALLAIALLATAISVAVAALSQVASPVRRTVTGAAAIATAVGGFALWISLPGFHGTDLALVVLLFLTAVAATVSRAFEVAGDASALLSAVRAAPRAAGALADALDGVGEAGDASVHRPDRAPLARTRVIDSVTLSAAGATAGLTWALAHAVGVLVPGVDLVLTAAMVIVIALVVRVLPEQWRRGPRIGGALLGGLVGLAAAGIAIGEAAAAVRASTPWWGADLTRWTGTVTAWMPFGAQVPATLLLAAAAAWILLSEPGRSRASFVALCLAGLSAPATLGLVWWSPIVIAGVLAIAAGVGAAIIGVRALARERVGLAAILGSYAVAVAMARPQAAAWALLGIVVAGVLVAVAAHARAGVGRAGAAQSAPLADAIVTDDLDAADPAAVETRRAAEMVAGAAAAAAVYAAPGAVATAAIAAGASRIAILVVAMAAAAAGVPALWAMRRWPDRPAPERRVGVPWLTYPVGGVGLAAFTVVLATAPDWNVTSVFAGVAALIAIAASATLPLRARLVDLTARDADTARGADRPARSPLTTRIVMPTRAAALIATAGPPAVVAVVLSGRAWVTALFGPFANLRQVWQGATAVPVPVGARTAAVTLALLTVAAGAAAVTLRGRRFMLAAVLPPLAALALVLPTALGAGMTVTPWVAVAVALATGLSAALVKPTNPLAARHLRATALTVCALTGAAGIAGSLATPAATLATLGIVTTTALATALLGRDPVARRVAWLVAAICALALPTTIFKATDRPLPPSAFGVLAVAAGLVGLAWFLSRPALALRRPGEADVIERAALVGSAFALLLNLGSVRSSAAVLTIWGVLLGIAALRADRPMEHRRRLVIAAALAELGAWWLLVYSGGVGLREAYTLPFALLALWLGWSELRRRPTLSSWIAYGPALAAGFLPSLALVLPVEGDLRRRGFLFTAAVLVVVVGAVRRRVAPVVTGGAVAIAVALHEIVVLVSQGAVAAYFLFGFAGIALVALGATYEKRRHDLQRLRATLRQWQ